MAPVFVAYLLNRHILGGSEPRMFMNFPIWQKGKIRKQLNIDGFHPGNQGDPPPDPDITCSPQSWIFVASLCNLLSRSIKIYQVQDSGDLGWNSSPCAKVMTYSPIRGKAGWLHGLGTSQDNGEWVWVRYGSGIGNCQNSSDTFRKWGTSGGRAILVRIYPIIVWTNELDGLGSKCLFPSWSLDRLVRTTISFPISEYIIIYI